MAALREERNRIINELIWFLTVIISEQYSGNFCSIEVGDVYSLCRALFSFARLAHQAGAAYVEGRLQTRKYTDKDGIEGYANIIVIQHMQNLFVDFKVEAAPQATSLRRSTPLSYL